MSEASIVRVVNKMGKTRFALVLNGKDQVYRSQKRSHTKNLCWIIQGNPDVDINKAIKTYRLLGEDYVTQLMRITKDCDKREMLNKMFSYFNSLVEEKDAFVRFFKPFHYKSKREYLKSLGYEPAYTKI